VKTCCEKIQPFRKWIGVRSKLLPRKKVGKVYTSTRKRSNYKGLDLYPKKKSV